MCNSVIKTLSYFCNILSIRHRDNLPYLPTPTCISLYRLLIVSSQVMESFVAHVCLIRPLGEGGKMRVAMDLAQLELVLGLFCRGDVSSLGHPYKMLRALRLLETTTNC